jgi:hypothetical protein
VMRRMQQEPRSEVGVGQVIAFCRLSTGAAIVRHDRVEKPPRTIRESPVLPRFS